MEYVVSEGESVYAVALQEALDARDACLLAVFDLEEKEMHLITLPAIRLKVAAFQGQLCPKAGWLIFSTGMRVPWIPCNGHRRWRTCVLSVPLFSQTGVLVGGCKEHAGKEIASGEKHDCSRLSTHLRWIHTSWRCWMTEQTLLALSALLNS